MNGGADNDSIVGGSGLDTILGEAGDDTFLGGGAADSILGGEGADSILGEAGADIIDAGDGANIVDAGADNDTIIGGANVDSLLGGTGNDTISGLAGGDTLIGFAAAASSDYDTLTGGNGSDTLVLGNGTTAGATNGYAGGAFALITDYGVGGVADIIQVSSLGQAAPWTAHEITANNLYEIRSGGTAYYTLARESGDVGVGTGAVFSINQVVGSPNIIGKLNDIDNADLGYLRQETAGTLANWIFGA